MHDAVGPQILGSLVVSMLVFKPKWEALFEAHPRPALICAMVILVLVEASR